MTRLTVYETVGIISTRVTGDAHRSETIGERLRRLRAERGVSQRDLSSPGISYAYISRIEAGARQPSVKALRMLARKLNVTPEYLETGSEIGSDEARELRLADHELRLRLDGETGTDELRRLLDDALTHSDVAAATRARIALGLGAAARGDYAGAIEQLGRVVDSELVTPLSRPDVYSTLGRAYAASGSPRAAVELFERGLKELGQSAPENLTARIRFSTYLSYALTDLGELQRAKAVVAEISSSSEGITDRYTRVRLLWSLGRIALEQAQPLAALDDFRRAVALLEATEDIVHLARAHIACADATLAGGDGAGLARRHLDEAERLLAPQPGREDLAVIRRLQAACAARSGEFAEAERLGEQALALALGLPNEHGHAMWVIAEARAGGGDPGADKAFLEAIALLSENGTVREHANVLRAYGRFLRETRREREALDVFERAADVASNLQGEPTTADRK